MADKIIRWRDFSRGLHLNSAEDELPAGKCLRNQNISRDSQGAARCRSGCGSENSIASLGAHSLAYFKDAWVAIGGANDTWMVYGKNSTILSPLQGIFTIKTLTSTERVSFTQGDPTSEAPQHLFCANGTDFFKFDSEHVYVSGSDLITNGDMEAAGSWTDVGSPSSSARTTENFHGGEYSWKFVVDAADEGVQSATFTTGNNTNHYVSLYVYMTAENELSVYLTNGLNGASPAEAYRKVYASGDLAADEWHHIEFVAHNTNAGSNSRVVVTSADTTSGTYYIDDVTCHDCDPTSNVGIVAPTEVPTTAAGAAGNPNGAYAHRVTYKNSYTGHRSNGSPIPAGTGGTANTLRLLEDFNGADGNTGPWTSDDPLGHTITGAGTGPAQLDTAQQKFGSASLLLNGTDDYVYVADHELFDLGGQQHSHDMWLRFNTLPSSGNFMGVWQQRVSSTDLAGIMVHHPSGASGYMVYFWNVETDISNQLLLMATGVSLSTATWYHLAIIRGWKGNLNQWALTLDGTALVTLEQTWTYTNPAAVWEYGRCQLSLSAAQYFDGWIDSPRLHVGEPLWVEDFDVPTSEPAGTETVTVTNQAIDLSNIPQSADPQVDTIEVWRTEASGTTFYKVAELPHGDTTFTDDVADSDLYTEELPINNAPPYSFFTDHYAGYNGAMFWITDSEPGQRGHLFYSPPGRLESMDGYINVSSDNDPLQKIFWFAGNLYVLSRNALFIVHGTDPYYSRKVHGVPGTDAPDTVVVTPYGVAYKETVGSIRLFNGSTAESLSKDDIAYAITGEETTHLTSFTGVIASYANDEYIVSNEASTILGYNFVKRSWREIYIDYGNSTGLAHDPVYGAILMGFEDVTNPIKFERMYIRYHDGVDITMEIETPHVRLGGDSGGVIKQLHLDYQSGASGPTVQLRIDGTTVTLSTPGASTGGRTRVSLPVNRTAKEFGVRFTAVKTNETYVPVLYGITAECWIPEEELE